MRRHQNLIVWLVFASLSHGAIAAELPRPGLQRKLPLRADTLQVAVDLQPTEAVVTLNYGLTNPTSTPVAADIAVRPGPGAKRIGAQRVEVAPAASAQVTQTLKIPTRGTGTKGIRVGPQLEIDGGLAMPRFDRIAISVKLPPGVTELVGTTLGEGARTIDPTDRRVVLTYQIDKRYAVPFRIRWRDDGVVVHVEKVAVAGENGVDVVVKVTNRGSQTLTDLVVSDNFHPALVSGGTPAKEFTEQRGQDNDVRLVWVHRLKKLDAGETVELRYQLALTREAPAHWRFGSTTVTRGKGEMLAYSPKVELASQ